MVTLLSGLLRLHRTVFALAHLVLYQGSFATSSRINSRKDHNMKPELSDISTNNRRAPLLGVGTATVSLVVFATLLVGCSTPGEGDLNSTAHEDGETAAQPIAGSTGAVAAVPLPGPFIANGQTIDSHLDAFRTSLEKYNKSIVLNAYDDVFAKGGTDRINKYFAQGFIQHDAAVGAGLQGLVDEVLASLSASPRLVTTIKHTIADGHYVFVHSQVSATPQDEFTGFARADLYRLDRSKIVEHWGFQQAVPAASKTGNSMFSDLYQYAGPMAAASNAQEDANKQLVSKAIPTLFASHNLALLDQFWLASGYQQHNPNMDAGLQGVKNLAGGTGAIMYQPRFVVAEGDLVFMFAQDLFGAPVPAPLDMNNDFNGSQVGDLVRVVNGVTVEHWDVLTRTPATTSNGNSVFSELYIAN